MPNADEEKPSDSLGEPWAKSDDEYRVLVDLLIPFARDSHFDAVGGWLALDTKALGILAIDAAALGVLVAVHGVINALWWIDAAALSIAGAMLVWSMWMRDLALGPDPIEFHDKFRADAPLAAARELLNDLVTATDENEATLSDKAKFFLWGLWLLAAALIGCVPLALLRPS